MESTVDVFLIQEGQEPNPSGKAYFTLPAAESMAVLGAKRGERKERKALTKVEAK